MKFIIILMLSLTATFAQAEDFDYVETNTFVKHSDSGFTLGIRENINLDVSQIIVRKDFTGTPWRKYAGALGVWMLLLVGAGSATLII